MSSKIEGYRVEKIPTPRNEPVHRTAIRLVKKEFRIIRDGLISGLSDSFLLLKRTFVPQEVDRGIKPQTEWFAIEPDNPNGKAILLCHGFGATPEIYRELAPQLAAQGYYVQAIRLSGHGTSLGHLAKTTAVEWFASVVWHYKQVAKQYDDITYIGHSLGGTLGMILATIYPLSSIICMCSPVELDIPPAKFVREASILVKYWPRSRGKRKAIEANNLSSYPASPLYAIGGIFDATQMLRERADKLTLPMLYVSARKDHKTLLVQPQKIEKYLTSTPVTIKHAENSPHSLLQGPEKDMVADWIKDWLAEH